MAVAQNGPATGFPNQSSVPGGGILGIYANSTALQTAKPAASNANALAAVGASAPYALYTSDGSAWVLAQQSGGYEVVTWADLPDPTTVAVGRTYTVLGALCTGGATGTRWQSNGTFWRPAGTQVLYFSATQIDGAAGGTTTEQLLASILLPSGALRGCRNLRLRSRWIASGGDGSTRTSRWRLGSAGTSGDTVIASFSVAANARVVTMPQDLAVVSSTAMRTNNATVTDAPLGDNYAQAATSASADVTVPSLTGALYLSASMQQSGYPTVTVSLSAITVLVE